MEEDKRVQLLTDYLDGNLSKDEILEVEKELTNNSTARKTLEQLKEVLGTIENSNEFEPSQKLQQHFDAFLETEINEKRRGKVVFFQSIYFKAAAVVLMLIVAGGVGYFISEQQNSNRMVAKNKAAHSVMMAKLENQFSVSERLIGIHEVYDSKPDDDLVLALIKLMNEDENTNVRMAAVNALIKFYDEPLVRHALIDALNTQVDPLVQMELIQILVYKKEQEAVQPLENIINDDQTLQAVKDEAYAGLFSLS